MVRTGAAMFLNDDSVSLVMPCRNEERHLRQLVASVPDLFDEVIIVNNRSTDGTWDLARQLSEEDPRICPMTDNRVGGGGIGYGYALMTGIGSATSDWVVCADSDGTYPIDVTPEILEWCLATGHDFASCSRYPDRGISPMLRLGVNILNVEIALLYGLHLADSLSGMWVFRREVIPALELSAGDWNLSPQIKLHAWAALGERFAEYKVSQRVRLGSTKQHYFRTGMSHLLWILRARRPIMQMKRERQDCI